MKDGHFLVWRNHIHAIWLHQGAVSNLRDFHAGGALEQFGHDALSRWVQVLNDDIGQTAARRNVRQKLFQGPETAG